jgi:hypothetical protein
MRRFPIHIALLQRCSENLHPQSRSMAKCASCGAETELRELDVPICPECIGERERIHPSFATLSAELSSAREFYRQAMEDLERQHNRCRLLSKTHPDRSTTALLEERAKAAGEKYWDLLRMYSEALRRNGE